MRTYRPLHACVWGVMLVCVLVTGCEPAEPPTGPVKGRVTLDGTPLGGVTVFIRNPETTEGVNVQTGDDGTYEVVSHRNRGMLPGTYQVAVRPQNEVKSDQEIVDRMVARTAQKNPWQYAQKPKTQVPVKYHNPATSGLKIVVAAHENPPFDFDLSSK